MADYQKYLIEQINNPRNKKGKKDYYLAERYLDEIKRTERDNKSRTEDLGFKEFRKQLDKMWRDKYPQPDYILLTDKKEIKKAEQKMLYGH